MRKPEKFRMKQDDKIIGVICYDSRDFISSVRIKLKDPSTMVFNSNKKEIFDLDNGIVYHRIIEIDDIRGRTFHKIVTSDEYYKNRKRNELIEHLEQRMKGTETENING